MYLCCFLPGIDDEASMVLIGSPEEKWQQTMKEIANKILESLTYLKFRHKTSGRIGKYCCGQSNPFLCLIFVSSSNRTGHNVSIHLYKTS